MSSRNIARRGRRPRGGVEENNDRRRGIDFRHVRQMENPIVIANERDDNGGNNCEPISPVSSDYDSNDDSSSVASIDIPPVPRAVRIDELFQEDQVVPQRAGNIERQGAAAQEQNVENEIIEAQMQGNGVVVQGQENNAEVIEARMQINGAVAQEQGGERGGTYDNLGGNERAENQQENIAIELDEIRRPFDERMEEVRERAWRGAVEAALGGEPPHVVAQRQIEEQQRREEAEERRFEEERRLRNEWRREEQRRQEERRIQEQQREDERVMRYRRLLEERRRRGGPQIDRNHNRVIRLEVQNRPRRMEPPAPGLIAGVIPFANMFAPRNEGELEFFEAVEGERFLVVNGEQGQGPIILHVSGLCAVAPDGSTWRCLRCIRRGSRNGFGGWRNWWMHHLHLTGLRTSITNMICPGCRELAFVYYSRYSCQACVEVYQAHREELLLEVVFEATIGRIMMAPRANAGNQNL
ncbi:hypothetical protein QAD02_002762 [Eretmocerus hayati]|uniref:Uncharacterized protein n=1 Tax=Eretmocerus hayati TaxID=131215 RepID=A0ACC2NKS4_9HYME|nr:hypothetical protein QAD02_002762 [Eretmocerus hayati]